MRYAHYIARIAHWTFYLYGLGIGGGINVMCIHLLSFENQ